MMRGMIPGVLSLLLMTMVGCTSVRYFDADQRSDVALPSVQSQAYQPAEAILAARLVERAYDMNLWHLLHKRGQEADWNPDWFLDPPTGAPLEFDPELLLAKSGWNKEIPEAFGFVARDDDTLYIALRGTHSANNWYDNLLLQQTLFQADPEQPIYIGGLEPLVHSGFYRIYMNLRDQLHDRINTYLATPENPDAPSQPTALAGGADPAPPAPPVSPKRLVLAGHSLGGALATLASLDLASDPRFEQILLYTFGSPRVGDSRLAIALKNRGVIVFRFANSEDSVPHLPPSNFSNGKDETQLYQHVGYPAVFTAQRGSVAGNHSISLYRHIIERDHTAAATHQP